MREVDVISLSSQCFVGCNNNVIVCQCSWLHVPRFFGALVEEHLDVFVLDMLLDLLNPLEADAGGAHDESSPGLDLRPGDPTVWAEVLAPVGIGHIILHTLAVLLRAALPTPNSVPCLPALLLRPSTDALKVAPLLHLCVKELAVPLFASLSDA